MDIKAVKERFQRLSVREKVIVALTAAVVVFVLPYLFLYSPSSKALEAGKQVFSGLEKETSILGETVKTQAPLPPTSQPSLPHADDLGGMFMSISAEAARLGIGFISMAPESVTEKDRFTEMRLKIELRLRYRELFDFIGYLTAKHRLFLIESLSFETNDAVYPSGIAVIKAVTYLKKR